MWMCLTSRKGIEVPTISVQCTKFSKETFCFQADHQTPLIWCLVGKTQSVTTDLLTQKKKFSRSQSTSDRKEEGRGLTSGHYDCSSVWLHYRHPVREWQRTNMSWPTNTILWTIPLWWDRTVHSSTESTMNSQIMVWVAVQFAHVHSFPNHSQVQKLHLLTPCFISAEPQFDSIARIWDLTQWNQTFLRTSLCLYLQEDRISSENKRNTAKTRQNWALCFLCNLSLAQHTL